METYILGPYHPQMYGFVLSLANSLNGHIQFLVSPRGFHIRTAEVDLPLHGKEYKVPIVSEFETHGKSTFIVLPFGFDNDYEVLFFKKLIERISEFSKILCMAHVSRTTIENVIDAAERNQCAFEMVAPVNSFREPQVTTAITEIPFPVVAVASAYSEEENDNVTLLLVAALRRRGLTVLLVDENPVGAFMSDVNVLDLSQCKRGSLNERIIKINQLIAAESKKMKPDIIIVGIPGVFQSLSEKYPIGFGADLFTYSQALGIDHLLLGIPYINANKALFDELSMICRYRYSASGCSFYLGTKRVEELENLENAAVSFRPVPEEIRRQTARELKTEGVPIWFFDSFTDAKTSAESLMECLFSD